MKTDLPSVYLDSCCFIDLVKVELGEVLEKGRQSQEWFYRQILRACADGNLTVYTSQLTMNECTGGGLDDNEEVQRKFDAILRTANGVIPINLTYSIQDTARSFSWRNDIKLKCMDSLHIASALKVRAAEFITTDGETDRPKSILKQSEKIRALGLRVIRASDSLQLPEKYRQQQLELTSHEQDAEQNAGDAVELASDGIQGSPENSPQHPTASLTEAEIAEIQEEGRGKARLMEILNAPPGPTATNVTMTTELKNDGMLKPKVPIGGETVEPKGRTSSLDEEEEQPYIPEPIDRRRALDFED